MEGGEGGGGKGDGEGVEGSEKGTSWESRHIRTVLRQNVASQNVYIKKRNCY